MHREDFDKILEKVAIAFNRSMAVQEIEVWWDIFQSADSNLFKRVLMRSILELHEFPSIAWVRKSISIEEWYRQ